MKRLRGWARSLLHPPRKIAFTREGLLLILFTFPLGLAAINTGNNMLYLILGMLLSVIALNGVFSESSIKKLSVNGRLPHSVFAGDPLVSFVDVRNVKKYLPTYLLRIRHLWQENLEEKFLALSRTKKSGPINSDDGYLVKLSAGKAQKLRLVSLFEDRGIYTLKGYRLATLFPFGLFDKLRELTLPAGKESRVVVYPKPLKTELREFSPWLHAGTLDMNARGFSGDLYALREYQSSDDARYIHWKLSAKMGRPIVRDQAATGKRRLLIGFDTRLRGSVDPKTRIPAFEKAVSQIAYLVLEALRNDVQVGLATPEQNFPPQAGEEHFHEIMKFLATVKPLPFALQRDEHAAGKASFDSLNDEHMLMIRPLVERHSEEKVHPS